MLRLSPFRKTYTINNPIVAILLVVLGLLVGMLVWTILLVLPTMLLWNWLMPMVFGLKQITLLQACGLLLLCYITGYWKDVERSPIIEWNISLSNTASEKHHTNSSCETQS